MEHFDRDQHGMITTGKTGTETVPTIDIAMANASRLLHAAEIETNHSTMERLEKLADSWVSIAGMLIARERD